MRHVRWALVFLSGALLAAAAEGHGGVRHDFRLVNGKWFDGTDFVARTVFTAGGVFRRSWSGPVEGTIDLHGGYVVPPFADAHNHSFGLDENVAAEMKEFLRQGIFYVKNPNDIAELSSPVRARMNQPSTIDIVYSHGGLTSSGGHPAQIYDALAGQGRLREWTRDRMPGHAYFVVDDEQSLQSEWPRLLATKPDFVKTYLEHSEEWERRRADPAFFGRKGLNPALLARIVVLAHAAGLRVSTHIATAADFRNALAAGVDEINHLPLERLTDDDAKRAAASKTVIVSTTLSHRSTEGIADLDSVHRENLKRLHAAGAILAIGLDSHGTVLSEAENIHRLAPFDDRVLLDAWTRATARTIFPNRKIGCLDEGCEASFVSLSSNPLEDFGSVRKIALRMKDGFLLESLPSVGEAVRRVLKEKGADAATAAYRELRSEAPPRYDFSETELNKLGYELLKSDRWPDAVAIFRLNAEAWPRSPNAQDSLEEACAAAGDRECSREAARKVLQLIESDTALPPAFKSALRENARKTLAESKPQEEHR